MSSVYGTSSTATPKCSATNLLWHLVGLLPLSQFDTVLCETLRALATLYWVSPRSAIFVLSHSLNFVGITSFCIDNVPEMKYYEIATSNNYFSSGFLPAVSLVQQGVGFALLLKQYYL